MIVIIFFSIAAVAPFAGLRRFPQGRGFKQWTGDDSKALMKVKVINFPSTQHQLYSISTGFFACNCRPCPSGNGPDHAGFPRVLLPSSSQCPGYKVPSCPG